MVDIHCHILYGTDDGSSCLSESVEMARIAFESGTDKIIATPHANAPGMDPNVWNDRLEMRLTKLNNAIKEAGIPIEIFPGQEVFCAGDIVKKRDRGEIITLNGSRYMLVEFDFYARTQTILDQCNTLLSEGIIPIVAHPERYEALKENRQTAFKLKRLGCLLQLNCGSLFGAFGRTAQRTAHIFLTENLADFLASDAHSPYMRTPFMADSHEMVCEMYDPDYADLLFRINPDLVLKDREINAYY